MPERPTTRRVVCPECSDTTHAVVPKGSTVVTEEDDADGKVWVDCRSCDARFDVYYREEA